MATIYIHQFNKPNSCSTEIWKKIKAIKGITHHPLQPILKHNNILLSSSTAINDAFVPSFEKNNYASNFDPVFFTHYKHNIENTITHELQNNFHHQDNHLNTSISGSQLFNYMSNCKSESPWLNDLTYSFI